MKPTNKIRLRLIFVFFLYLLNITKIQAQNPQLASLGRYAALAGNNLTDNNPNLVYGLLGCGGTLSGSSASSDSTLFSGQELTEAVFKIEYLHDSLFNLTPTTTIETGEIEDNNVFESGIYTINGNLNITDNYSIYLQSNDSNSIFIFNISEDLIIGNNVQIVLDGVKLENVFWNSRGNITIKSNSHVLGTFISNSSLTIESGVSGSLTVYAALDLEVNTTQHLYSYSAMKQKHNTIINTTCVNNCPKQSLVINGSFDAGSNNYFYTDLIKWESGSTYGHYYIGSNPSGFNNANNGNWSLTDHTNNGGGFLMVDGFVSALQPANQRTIWKQSNYIVQPNQTYRFSFFIGGLTIPPNSNTAQFAVYVNGTMMAEYIYNLPSTTYPNALGFLPNSWQQHCFEWTASSTVTNAEVEIIQIGLLSVGLDFGLDDISFVDISLGPDVADAGADINTCYQPNITIGGIMDNCFSISQNTYSWTPTTGLSSYNIPNPTLLPVSNSSNTTYTLSVVSNGNTTTDQVNVVLNPSIELNTTETQIFKVCAGIPTVIQNNIVPINGNGTYQYTWSPALPPGSLNTNTANPTIALQVPNFETYYTYTVTVSSLGSCAATFTQLIYVDPEPDALFQIYDDGYNSTARTFTAFIDNENLTYNWSFSDGTSATGRSTIKHFNGGRFNVKLTVSDQCNRVASTNQQFDCSPMYNNYNPAFCADRDAIISYDITGNYSITNNTLWTNSSGIGKIKGTLTITSGNTLTIQNRTVRFGLTGKIIIEPGAKLIIDGATLTGIDETFGPNTPCRTMWQGIEVWGNQLYSHNTVSQQAQQGKLIMKNGASIINAHKAIFVGKQNNCIPGYNCNTIRGIQTYIQGYGGGLLDIQGSIFSNNAIDIEFAPFVSGIGTSYTNRSIIKNNTFSGGTLLDPAYDSDILNSSPYPNSGNPYYASANKAGRSSMQLKSYKIYNLNIYDNTFSNAEHGIYSIDSRLNISKAAGNGNNFSNLAYGIHTLYTGTTFDYAHTISYNRFNRMSMAAIRSDGGRYINIKQNLFGNNSVFPQSNQDDNPLGIYLDGNSNFNINDNTFYRIGVGVRVLESEAAGGKISTDNGSGNKFIRNFKGIVTSGNNPNLQIRCNQHDNTEPSDYMNRNWDINGLLGTQGSDEDHTKPAGNELRPTNRKDIYSSSTFWYYAHARAVDQTEATLPTAANGSTWQVISNLQNTGIIKKVNSCIPAPPCSPNCEAALNNNADWRAYLEHHYEEIMENLDQGNTENLILALNNPLYSSNDLKELLLQYSPLSELVISAVLNNTNRFTLNDFLSVLEVNMPVSSELWDLNFVPILNILDTSSAAQLKAYQLNDSGEAETLAGIEAEYLQAINEQQIIIEEMVMHEIEYDPVLSAQLLSLQAKENQEVAASTYLARGDYASAYNLIDELVNEYEYYDWASLSYINHDVLQNQKDWFGIDNSQENEIRRIQQESPEVKAKLNAQAILSLLYGESFPMRMQESNLNRNENKPLKKKYAFKNQNSIDNFLNPYPNPANEAIYVPYNNASQELELSIYNAFGQLLDKQNLQKGYQIKRIVIKDLPSGIYFFAFTDITINKTITKKVLIQH